MFTNCEECGAKVRFGDSNGHREADGSMCSLPAPWCFIEHKGVTVYWRENGSGGYLVSDLGEAAVRLRRKQGRMFLPYESQPKWNVTMRICLPPTVRMSASCAVYGTDKDGYFGVSADALSETIIAAWKASLFICPA